ncbi:hypothetical protein N431DRAFT_504371 [Stipitochalara longipes BDJ]|nr:hypothetical protein N431DRAFT_504371 [Stipitochalara longipes BDJ]
MDKRVRTGCATCRKRRIKCDERKPSCARCEAANFVCEGYSAPRRVGSRSPTASSSTRSPNRSPPREENPFSGLSWRHTSWRQEQLPLYHHFVTTTAVRLFRIDHVSFWRDQVAQLSVGFDLVYEALLAVGALHRASLLNCQNKDGQEAARSRVLGLHAYGNALRMLPTHLSQNAIKETIAVQAVLILLTFCECMMENPKGALRHLWAAIQLLRRSEESLSDAEISNMVPLYDAMLRLDFLAQKLVPYSSSSFLRCPNQAMMTSPFWNRISPEFSGMTQLDRVATERYRLIQLICGHNKLSRVVWGSWCPANQRPSREECLGFYSEIQLWKANSPATFASCDALDILEASTSMPVESRPIPPPVCEFPSNETALNIAMYNAYLGCAVAMISATEEDPSSWDSEAFNLSYQTLSIAAGLIERKKYHEKSITPYKPCDAVSIGISIFIFQGACRCFSLAWRNWTVDALRAIGREGLSNGFTWANTIAIMGRLETGNADQLPNATVQSALGSLRYRVIPLLMPRGDDEYHVAFYFRERPEIEAVDDAVHVSAKAMWKENLEGSIDSLKLEVYDSVFSGFPILQEKPEALDLFSSWRQAVAHGWHGYLGTDIQEELLQI